MHAAFKPWFQSQDPSLGFWFRSLRAQRKCRLLSLTLEEMVDTHGIAWHGMARGRSVFHPQNGITPAWGIKDRGLGFFNEVPCLRAVGKGVAISVYIYMRVCLIHDVTYNTWYMDVYLPNSWGWSTPAPWSHAQKLGPSGGSICELAEVLPAAFV